MAFGNGSTTVPSTRIASSLGFASELTTSSHGNGHFGRTALQENGCRDGPGARKTGSAPTGKATPGVSPQQFTRIAENRSPGHREDLGAVVADRDGVLEVGGRRASAVTTVQPSSRGGSRPCPALTIGSMAITNPVFSRSPRPAGRSWAPADPRASRCRCRGRRTPARPRTRRSATTASDTAPTSPSRLPATDLRRSRPAAPAGDVDQPLRTPRRPRRPGPSPRRRRANPR